MSHGGAIGGVGSALLVLVPAGAAEEGGGEEDPVALAPVKHRPRPGLHVRNSENTGTAFPCQDSYIEPVNTGRGPVAAGFNEHVLGEGEGALTRIFRVSDFPTLAVGTSDALLGGCSLSV